MKNIIIIPSLDPNEKLIKITNSLLKEHQQVLVVDDGSKDKRIYEKLDKKITILHHDINKGKGAAIKTGVRYVKENINNVAGYVFMDSDGQHTIEDAVKISDAMIKNDTIILGVRNFNDKDVPLRSKIGNKFSSIYFKLSTGLNLQDTQTGLRAIPFKYTDILLNTEDERFEYEMNFLMNISHKHIPFKQIQIKTIYEDNNSVSHFNTIKDSIRIYQKPIKYLISSISSFILDILLFIIIKKHINIVFISNISARILSGIYNYNINKYWCFKTYNKNQGIKYFLLFITQMLLSSSLLNIYSSKPNLVIIKVLIDITLYIINYFIQRRYIFNNK